MRITHFFSRPLVFIKPTKNARKVRQRATVERLENRCLLSVTYYVSASGNDSASGTSIQSAWNSLARVNSVNLEPGDRVLLEGGKTFSGGLQLTSSDAGTSSNPVIIDSHGTGRAKINAGAGSAITATNAGGISIQDLTLVGSGYASNDGSGIHFVNTLPGNVKYSYLRVSRVEATGFGKFGVLVDSEQDKSGFRDVRITHVEAHQNAGAGIYVFGNFSSTATGYAHENVYVGNSSAYNNPGVSGTDLLNTGNSIVLSDVNGGVIQRSVAHSNGWLSNSSQGGPVGIWAWDSNNITIQYNESYRNRTAGPHDGGGFDLDGGVTNSVMQYNYSHDNDGAGYMLCTFGGSRTMGNNVVRFNISENDARKNSKGAIFTYGDVGTSNIYNNSVYMTPAGSAAALRVGTTTDGLAIRNNIFQTTGGAPLIDAVSNTGVTFEGNAYWSSGASFTIRTGGATYTSLSNWRNSTAHEMLKGVAVGYQVNPLFRSPGQGVVLSSPSQLESLDAYDLQATSPLIDKALNLMSLFSINMGTRDFSGTPILDISKLDLGAVESSGSTSSTGTGLAATYYNSTTFSGTSISRVDPTVSFDWGTGSPDAAIASDGFSARWTGQVQPAYSETYRFYVRADDGVRLWVNNQLLVDKWIVQAPTEYSGTIALQAGQKYTIKLEYYENVGGAVAELRWSSASTAKAIIPSNRLFAGAATPSSGQIVASYTSGVLGSPAITGSTTTITAGSAYDITAGGSDIYGTSDQGRFVYRSVTGDFDTSVRLQSLSNVDAWTKAGLMVRASLAAGSVNAFMLATPTAYRFTARTATNASTSIAGSGTTSYPNTWLRLKRTGNVVQGFRSTDGINWTVVSQTTLALPSTVLVGMAVTSHNTSTPATASFRNLT